MTTMEIACASFEFLLKQRTRVQGFIRDLTPHHCGKTCKSLQSNGEREWLFQFRLLYGRKHIPIYENPLDNFASVTQQKWSFLLSKLFFLEIFGVRFSFSLYEKSWMLSHRFCPLIILNIFLRNQRNSSRARSSRRNDEEPIQMNFSHFKGVRAVRNPQKMQFSGGKIYGENIIFQKGNLKK